jgi:hypothetical protein
MTRNTAQPPDTPPGWGRIAGIAALYALLGPLVGAIAAVGLLVLIDVVTVLGAGQGDAAGAVHGRGFLLLLAAGLPVAYGVGLPSSVAVGVIVALRDRREGAISRRAALAAALALWVVMSALAALVISTRGGLLTWLGMLLAAHVLAAMVCTRVARRLFSARVPS